MSNRVHLRRKAALRKVFQSAYGILLTLLGPIGAGWFLYGFCSLDLVEVNQKTALQGRVTKCDVNRQHFNWYLNNDESTRYDLWSFGPADAATNQLVTADSLEYMADVRGGFQYYKTLGFYLRKGARLRKEANSPYVVVEQDHRTTRWQYRP